MITGLIIAGIPMWCIANIIEQTDLTWHCVYIPFSNMAAVRTYQNILFASTYRKYLLI